MKRVKVRPDADLEPLLEDSNRQIRGWLSSELAA